MSAALHTTHLARRLAASSAWSTPARAVTGRTPPSRRASSIIRRAEGEAVPAAVADAAPATPAPVSEADVPLAAKLDIRVGRILEVEVHPDADG